jgi:hypothetical protein
MELDQLQIKALVADPTESLNVELKRWIDPGTLAGQQKIVRASLALRNRNGGYLVVGFDDATFAPDLGHELPNVRTSFHPDDIQALVSRYSQELFEVGVGFSTRDGIEYPVIVVPPGVQTPVAAKRNMMDGSTKLIGRGDVYFRTLASNGTPSTSLARPEDCGKWWRFVSTTEKPISGGFCVANLLAKTSRRSQPPYNSLAYYLYMNKPTRLPPSSALLRWKTARMRCLTMALIDFVTRFKTAILRRVSELLLKH